MMVKIFIGVLIVGLAIVSYVVLTLPENVTISRTQNIMASPDKIFPYLNNPHRIQDWNPFLEDDPGTKITYAGPTEGVDARWTWEGNKSGAGQGTIVAVETNKKVSLRMEFTRPFKVTNASEYLISQQGPSCAVTWSMIDTALVPRIVSRFVNTDKLIGTAFEKGLAKLKGLAENSK